MGAGECTLLGERVFYFGCGERFLRATLAEATAIIPQKKSPGACQGMEVCIPKEEEVYRRRQIRLYARRNHPSTLYWELLSLRW